LKKSHHMILTLTLVGVLSSLALAGIYKYTKPMIRENQRRALEEAIFQVLPGTKTFKAIKKDKMIIYQGFDSSGKPVGYAFVGEGPGYQGIIKVMIGVSPDLKKMFAIEILESVETPGLGQKITTPSFRNQFQKKPIRSNQIQAITGATISSRAIVDIVNATVGKVRKVLGK